MNRIMALGFVLLLTGCAARPELEPNPYSADQIARLLRGAVNPDRILYDAQRECVSFRITPEVRTLFADAGATESFIEALQAACFRAVRSAAGRHVMTLEGA